MSVPKWSKAVTPLLSHTLDLPPSCIEFVPRSRDKLPCFHTGEYFVVGTYHLQRETESIITPDVGTKTSHQPEDSEAAPQSYLEAKPQSRNGSLNLFKLTGHKFRAQGQKLRLIQKVPCPSAVLDLHFHPVFSSTLGVVTSTGAISIYNLAEELVTASHGDVGDSPFIYSLKHRATHQVFSPDTIITSFAWYRATGESNFKQPSSDLMACTTSNNSVYLVRLNWVVDHEECAGTDQEYHYHFDILNDGQPINKHDLEAWCCTFGLEGTVYSGGDDGKIRATPLYRDSFNKAKDVEPQEVARQTVFSGHGAGVTAILVLPLPSSPLGSTLLTGSYDDYVRVYAEYDFRPYVANTKPKALAELKIGGGVWRLKFLQDYPISAESGVNVKYRVLASCMHEGARILEVSGNQMGEWKIEVLASMKIHESMCYAADVKPLAMNPPLGWDETRLCVSTSFYDKLLCAWSFNPKLEAETPGEFENESAGVL
ncbi:hypothetical protein N431DRAFT_413224 [Stipitochalara longipes BDJ]|nr:hypothetical protein N431DRAFT_413224 [Stipitochalara longipes BDJ]